MKYDKEVLTINDILTALDNFDNKEEIINAIKRSLYDIETDWHYEEYLRQQLQSYKDKEEKLREYIYSVNNWNWKKLEGKNGTQIIREELLQILNEGDK